MGKEATQDIEVKDGSQTGNPPQTSVQQPNPAEELAKLQREKEELAKKIEEKDKFITDLSTEKATLETRLRSTATPSSTETNAVDVDVEQEASRILETAQLDPKEASKQMASLLAKVSEKTKKDIISNLGPIVDQNTYISKIKVDNADLIDLGLEPSITMRANVLMSQGKKFNEAIDMAVKESREKVSKLKTNIPVTPPPSANAETGANNLPPSTPPARVETEAQEIAKRQELRRKKGL